MAYEMLQVDESGRILEDVSCSGCDASLEGENAGGVCPNCGEPIALSLVGRAVAHLDRDGRVTDLVACLTCGYGLRGIEGSGVCPECHTPVGPSLEFNLLRYADASWVKRVADGLLLYFLGLLLAIGMGIGNMVLGIIFQNDPAIRAIIGLAVTIVLGVFLSIAVWWTTAPDPDVHLPVQKRLGANLARLFIIPQYVLTLPGLYYAAVATSPAGQLTAGLIQMPVALIGVVVAAGLMLHFAQLAKRVVDEKLERWARIILWLNVVGSIVGVIGGSIAMASMLAAGGAPGTPGVTVSGGAMVGLAVGGLAGCAGGLVGIVATIWQLILVYQLRRYFARGAKAAVRS